MTGAEVDDRRLPLAPAPESVAVARRFVAAALREWALDELDVEAQTVVSELMTNAVLHAGVGIECGLTRLPDGVRIEVRDGAAAELLLPASVPPPRASLLDSADDLEAVEALLLAEATTGRGLQVVGELATAWGVDRQPDGKLVWVTLCLNPPEVPAAGRPASARTAGRPATQPPDLPGRPVRFVAVPVRLALQSDLQLDTLVREFQVMGLPQPDRDEPRGLVRAAQEILEHYAAPRQAGRRAARDAVARGDRLVDVTLLAPEAAAPALRHLLALLHEVDAYCRNGQLLALASSPELQAFRLWYVEEMERQFAGGRPRACPFPVQPWAPGSTPDPDPDPSDELDPEAGSPAADELARLATVLQQLDRTEDIARLVLAESVQALGADRASVCLVAADHENVDIVESIGYAAVSDHWSRFPLAADLPASEAIRTGRSVVVRTVSERNERYPVFAATPALEDPSFLCVPFGEDVPARGVLVLNFARSRDFSAHDLRLTRAFCAIAGEAFARVAADVERARRARLGQLADQLLAASAARPVADVLPEVAEALSRQVFEFCSAFDLADGTPRLLAAEHRDPVLAALARTLHTRWPPRLDEGGVGRALSSGETVVQQVIPAEILPVVAQDADHLELLRRVALTSTAVVAIRSAGGDVLGALAVADGAGRSITDSEIAFLRTLAADLGRALA